MQRQQLGQSISQQGFFSSRDTISQTCTNTGGGGVIGSSTGIGPSSSGGGIGASTISGKAHTSQAHVSATASEMDLAHNHQQHQQQQQQTRGTHQKDRSRLKGGEQPLLGSWNRSAGGEGSGPRGSNAQMLGAPTTASSNHLGSGCNGTDRYVLFAALLRVFFIYF